MKRKQRRRKRNLKPLILGAGAALLAYFAFARKGVNNGVIDISRSQEHLDPVYSGNIPVPVGTKPGTIIGTNIYGRRIIYNPEAEARDREILNVQKG